MSSAKIRIAHLDQLIEALLRSGEVPSTVKVEEICLVVKELEAKIGDSEIEWTINKLKGCIDMLVLFPESMAVKAMEGRMNEAINTLTTKQVRLAFSSSSDSRGGRSIYSKFPNGKMP